MSAPVALNSAALHTARQCFGRNGIEASPVGFYGFARCAVVSPTTLLVAGGLVFYLIVYVDLAAVLALLYLLSLLVVVLVWSACTSRRGATALQGCFSRSSAVAYREGTWALVGSAQLVPGDLVRLVHGCVVHADCALLDGSLLLDLSQLTGSSEVVTAEAGYLLKAGAVVVDGAGTAVVRYTNVDTFVGQTVKLLQHLSLGLTRPLVQRSYLLTSFAILVVVVTVELVLYGLCRGRFRWSAARVAHEMMLYAWVCLPTHLDVAVLLAVTRGAAVAMQRTHAIVLRLGALLSLASVDVLVADKSGTLTTGVYAVAATFRSFSPLYPSRDALVQLMALATRWHEPSLHPMRRAVLRCADLDACDQYVRLAYVEHDGERRTSAVLRHVDGTVLRVTEGTVNAVLALLGTKDTNPNDGGAAASGPDAELVRDRAEAQRLATTWGYRGLRTRAVAVGKEDGPWQLAGLVTFHDALRDDAAELARRCAGAGVSFTIASGDTKAVVETVAAAVLLPTGSSLRVMTGGDVPALEPWQALSTSAVAASTSISATSSLLMAVDDVGAAERRALAACHVYAEMQPQHKLSLVRLLQQSGRRVGLLGDGLNDAAAAQVADVGVALVTPDRGPPLTAQGAVWGADIALPCTRLTAVCDLIVGSRAIFAIVHRLFFYAFTVTLQTAMFIGLAALIGPAKCDYIAGQRRCDSLLSPSKLYLPFLVFLSVTCLLFQACESGDVVYWSGAPCRCSHPVAAAQSACMAVVGVSGGAPFALGLPLAFVFPKSDVDFTRATLRSTTATMYLFYLQLSLALICASPVRCGVRLLTGRVVYLACFVVVVGILVYFVNGFYLTVQLALLVYCALVSTLQDATKLAVHWVCYRHNLFGYRGCADHMTRRRRRQCEEQQQQTVTEELPRDNGFGGDDDGHEVPDGAVGRESAASAAQNASRPYSSALNVVLGCLVPLEMRLLSVAPSETSRAAAAAASEEA
ncbi:putative mitochondrial proton motive ATPase [Leptomonas pyrrhocoris]|uniref:Putative mitochondrial proton motive ATPase n=1 Tax=Leptomonas pyrrhocoris TaxID=157538 RepID=A0A0N0DS57_LEPPY|nr:putative mitochondrial proton motive ATPase [Leptomonas pyrrhocoris]KPA75612.1 putative mitochondrial proton motive ATPase [Leptomonas pyrrhocoris]|eukprot:XP_015654051.1 putative mitochondrial proton motive ATPase [Leptomonas pyrrhocoris]